MLRAFLFLFLVILCLLRLDSFAYALAGSSTQGGLRSSATVVRVTTLANAGAGSLREAVAKPFPRVIVFDVSGYITLTADLIINQPYVTIAGQTAPTPGVILRGGSVRVKAHNVTIEHVGIYSGNSSSSAVNDNRDPISVEGISSPSSEVILRNVSLGWGVDETFSTWFATTRKISLESSIIAEALNRAGHPKGPHSMSVLVGERTQDVLVAGNLIAHGVYRNPAFACGSSTVISNNLIYNPGRMAIHSNPCSSPQASAVSIIGNVVIAGPDTRAGEWVDSVPISAIVLPPNLQNPLLRIHQSDNRLQASRTGQRLGPIVSNGSGTTFLLVPPISSDWLRRPSAEVENYVLRYAGMRPTDRNPIDARIVSNVRLRRGKIINHPADVGGWPPLPPRTVSSSVPANPFSTSSDGSTLRIGAWLCVRHFEVGGASNRGCPNTPEYYRALL
jgi:hypothetical protein